MGALFYTAAGLAARGSREIPREFISNTHLIYSSPATLAFNSPGAEGYGVKRAGLAVPESVMLIVSPGCCGRNTSAISSMPGYEDRFFYLTMDQTDLVTGRHLKKIPKAVREICRGLEEKGKKPRVVMICITCVDALLGTDMERICRRAMEGTAGVRVRPCYMYALTREGRRPPMVHVRQSIYALLEPRKKKASSVNLLGFFAPVGEESELYDLLGQAGVRTIRQIGACPDHDAFQRMAEANFNLVLHPEARPAAFDLQERLGIPFIELRRFYQTDRIRAQYAALGKVLQTTFADEKWEAEARLAIGSFRAAFPGAVFSVGEAMNGDPFELACALVREGFAVREIFGTVNEENFVWIRLLASLSPDTRIYSNLHPSMLQYSPAEDPQGGPAVTIGRDAGWYHPELPNVQWNTDLQPFGYRAVTGLFRALQKAMAEKSRGSHASSVVLEGRRGQEEKPVPAAGSGRLVTASGTEMIPEETGQVSSYVHAVPGAGKIPEETGQVSCRHQTDPARTAINDLPYANARMAGRPQQAQPSSAVPAVPRGFRRYTTPFAPDQSGAVSVLYDMGGICVICDAGGCTGNICGFDEPRWFRSKSAVFSAGLRDMDAILGRDDRLVEKLAETASQIPADFAAIIGTPVPAVIGTDYRALCRMAEKKTGLPVLGIGTDGMEYYDRGMEKAYLALLETFCRKSEKTHRPGSAQKERSIGIWGYSPLDFSGILTEEALGAWASAQGYDRMICCGAGTDTGALGRISEVEKNIVLSPAGVPAAEWLEGKYGTPWEYCIPNLEEIAAALFADEALAGSVSGKIRGAAKPGPVVRENASAFSEDNNGKKAAGSRPGFSAGKNAEAADREIRILVVHQQVLAASLADALRAGNVHADAASFFTMQSGLMRSGDIRLREETDLRGLAAERNYDVVIADRALAPLLAGLPVRLVHLPHFAISGKDGCA